MTREPFATPFGRQLRSTGSFRGTMLSAVVHAGLVFALLWAGRRTFEDAANAPGAGRGRGGGGGGGGNRSIAIWTQPGPAQAPPAPPAPVPPPLEVPQTPAVIPEVKQETPAPAPPSAPVPNPGGPGEGAGTGAGSGPGAGTGTGGGQGSGTGPGIGADSGEGGGGRIFPPQPQGIILPPPGAPRNMRGVVLTVTFRISERGDVVDVSVDPPIRDRGYRNEFFDRMRRYTFTPAYTRDGRPIASEFPIQVTL